MPTPYLHGNGYTCPSCDLRRQADRARTILGSGHIDCNQCAGTGRIAYTEQEAYALQLADARKHHWQLDPDRDDENLSVPDLA